MEGEILPPSQIVALSAYEQLSAAKRSFVDAFVKLGDLRKAYVEVFPGASGHDLIMAYRWGKDPLIRAALSERSTAVALKNDITLSRVVQEIGALAFSNMRNYVKLNPEGLPYFDFTEVNDVQWAAVKSFTVEEYTEGRGDDARNIRKVKMELHDKPGSLDKLMKRFGAYAPVQVEHSIRGGTDQRQITVDMTPEQAAASYAAMLRGEE